MQDKLAIAKKIIRENYTDAPCGIFNTRNLLGDPLINIYDENGLKIDLCYRYEYFEVFGLTCEDFTKLTKYYQTLEHGTEQYDIGYEDGRKDTAREILKIIKREYDYIGGLERIIAKQYGVGVNDEN